MNPTAPFCSDLPIGGERCAASLPDNPKCAPNYHFGMLLGVEDFRAEQGFHVGRLRRHQRLLHGFGVVSGFAVSWDAAAFELRLGPGYGIDILGRDHWLESPRCVNLALWWDKHRHDVAFSDVKPGETVFDLDIVSCYANCLDRPVPAIAEPCAGDAADIAYARICETVNLALVRHDPAIAVTLSPSHHLLRLWFGLEEPARDAEGKLLPDDQWFTAAYAAVQALPAAEQEAAGAALLREVAARAAAAESPFAPELAGDDQGCLLIARLKDMKVSADGTNWKVEIGELQLGVRATLLPTALLQDLLLAEAAPPAAGPVLRADGASLAGDTLTLVFDRPLAAASVTPEAFAVSEFDTATGWHSFSLGSANYDESDPTKPTVTLKLDRAPVGRRLRITVIGSGSTPLLGKTLIPAAALHPEGDGRNLTTTLST